MGGLKADYNATIYPGGKDQMGGITVSALTMGFGSRIVMDGANGQFDQVNTNSLTIEAKTEDVWKNYGPRYKSPVLQINYTGTLEAGTYQLGTVGSVIGSVDDFVLEGIDGNVKASLSTADGKLLLVIENMREAGQVAWNGTTDNSTWQQASSENFLYDGQATYMASGDEVVFDDNAASTEVVISGAVSPKSVTFNNDSKDYTLSGDSIVGGCTITKNGSGKVVFNNWNHIGATDINGGSVSVAMLANNSGQTWGSLGSVSAPINLKDGATLITNGTIITDQTLNVSGETTVEVPAGKSVIFNKAIRGSGAIVNKTGKGSMEIGTVVNTFSKMIVKEGTVTSNYNSSNTETLPKIVEFQGGTIWGANMEGGAGVTNTTSFIVPQGKTGTFYSSFRGTYSGALTGAGTFNVYTGGVRAYFNGNWSNFEGTINIGKNNRQNKKSYDPEFLLGNANGMPKATVNVNANARLQNQGKSIRVKKFGGKGALVGTGTWIVDCDEDFTLTTEVGITSQRTDDYGNTMAVSASPLTKRGTGKMKMTEGMMNGVLTIEDGTVAVYKFKPAVTLNGTNATIVKGSGRFVGQCILNSLTAQSGGLVMPCASAVNETTPGTITVNNTVTVNEGAVVNFLVNKSKNSAINAKNLTFNGTVKVTFTADRELKEGDELQLWTLSGTFSGTPTFELPEEYTWDTSRISEGILVVTGISTGIKTMVAESDPRNVYDLNGRLVRRQQTANSTEGLPAGIYIRGGKKFVKK